MNADLAGEGKDNSELGLIIGLNKVAFISLRCFTLVRKDLKERLFLPLYTTLVAISASILHASCVLMVDCYKRYPSKSELPTLPFSMELGDSVIRGGSGMIPLGANDQQQIDVAIIEERTHSSTKPLEKEIEKKHTRVDSSKSESVVFDMVAMLGKRKSVALEDCLQQTARDQDSHKKQKKEQKDKKKKKKQQQLQKSAKKEINDDASEEIDEIDEIFRGIT